MEISSSNFPRFDRSLNSARPNADETKMPRAKQTLLHQKGYPSEVILPLIPRQKHLPGRPSHQ
jgi:predicted acyl esterase